MTNTHFRPREHTHTTGKEDTLQAKRMNPHYRPRGHAHTHYRTRGHTHKLEVHRTHINYRPR